MPTRATFAASAHRAFAVAALALTLAACQSRDPGAYVASAQRYLAKGDYAAAIIELKNALRDAPNRPDARVLMARALLESGDAVGAETESRKALDLKAAPDEVRPLLVRALLVQGEYRKAIAEAASNKVQTPAARAEVATFRGLAYLAQGDLKAANAALDDALSADEHFVPAKVAQVRVSLAEMNVARARQQVDAVLAAAPKDLEALVLKADLLAQAGQPQEGLKLLQEAAAIKPDSAPVRWALIIALVNAGDAPAAAQQLSEVKKLAPENPRTWYAEALVAYARNDLPTARAAVERAKNFAPNYMPALYLSGLIDLRLGALGSAETTLQTVVSQVPSDAIARKALASVYIRRGKSALALATLEPLLRQNPNDPEVLRQIAEAHFAANNFSQAAEQFTRASKVDAGNVAGRIRLAQVRLASGDSAQAFRDLALLAAADSGSMDADLALISAHLQRREFDKALVAAAALEAKQPTNPATHNVKGVIYMTRGDNRSARASFEKALSFDPNFPAALLNLARVEYVERNFDASRKRFEQLLAKDPKNEVALLGMVDVLIRAKAPPEQVRAAIDRAIAANPASVAPRLALIAYLQQQGDFKGAVAAATAAEAAIKDNAQILEALGIARLGAGETNQAIASLKRATQLQPENPSPPLRLAEIQVRTRDFDGAIDTLRPLVEQQPDIGSASAALAGAYADAGKSDAGIEYARRLQRQLPDKAAGYAIEGDLRARQGKMQEAAAAYRAAQARQPSPFVVTRLYTVLEAGRGRADANAVAQQWIKDNPDDVIVRAFLGEQYMGRKEYRLAAGYLQAAVEVQPDNVTLLNNLGWTLGELGDPKALDYAGRAYALAPFNPETADTYGWVLAKSGDYARGVPLLRQAAELAPNDAGKRLHLAQMLLKSGDKAGARKELEALTSPQVPEQVRLEAQGLLKGI